MNKELSFEKKVNVDEILKNEDLKKYVCFEEAPIVKVEVEKAFNSLDEKEKKYCHYLSKASISGSFVISNQVSKESTSLMKCFVLTYDTLFQKVESLLTKEEKQKITKPEGKEETILEKEKREDEHEKIYIQKLSQICSLPEKEISNILVYTTKIFSNHGNYESFGDSKFIPRCKQESLLKFVLSSKNEKAISYFSKVLNKIYSLSKDELYIDFGNNCYLSNNVTRKDGEFIQSFLSFECISPYNTILEKKNDDEYIIYQASSNKGKDRKYYYENKTITLKKGLFSDEMKLVSENLKKAQLYCSNDKEKKMYDFYIKHFSEGNIDDHKESQRCWVKNYSPTIETNIGFIESYRDPMRSRGEFEGFVALVNKEASKSLGELVQIAESTIKKLPWNLPNLIFNNNDLKKNYFPFEKKEFLKPDYTSLDVLTFTTSGLPCGINIPNYDDIRCNFGFKNVSLGNVINAYLSNKEIPFLDKKDEAILKKYKSYSYDIQVAIHELLGHGSGKLLGEELDENKKVILNFDKNTLKNPLTNKLVFEEGTYYKVKEDYNSKFKFSTSMEELRAELAALYLGSDEKIMNIFKDKKHDKEDQKNIIFSNWLSMVLAGIRSIIYYDQEKDLWNQAHCQARFAILKSLMKNSDFVKINKEFNKETNEFEDFTVKLDMSKFDQGMKIVTDMLFKIGIFKAVGDNVGADKYYYEITKPEKEHLEIGKIVLKKKKPSKNLVQSSTKLEKDKVKLVQFETSMIGFIKSSIFNLKPLI